MSSGRTATWSDPIDTDDWDIDIETTAVVEAMRTEAEASATPQKDHKENVQVKTPTTSESKTPLSAPTPSPEEAKHLEELIQTLKHLFTQNISLLDELAAADPEILNAYLKEHLGLHAARSFELVAHLTRDLMFINRELIRPEPVPLPLEQKDEKAYQALRAKLASSKPLRELVDHIWKLSSFLNIGKNIGAEAKSPSHDIQLSAATLNGAWLPEFLFGLVQLNPFLRHNPERVHEALNLFHDLMTQITSLDFIFFQEAWKDLLSEGPTRHLLKEHFTKLGYHAFGDETAKVFSLGSGVLGFSKHPIVDRTFDGFVKRRLGTETIAHKGLEAAKVLIDNKYIMTLVTTHETSGDGIIPGDTAYLGTSSEMRAEEEQRLFNLIQEWGNEPIINPETGKPYPHLGTVFGGDVNTTRNQAYQFLGLSTGKSFNSRSRYNVKSSGPFNLWESILSSLPKECWPIPKNSMDVLAPKTAREPGGKLVDPLLEKEAEETGFVTGSTYSVKDLKENKASGKPLTSQTTEHKVIDVLAAIPNNKEGLKAFESFLVSMVAASGKAISDHLMLLAVMLFATPTPIEPPLPTLSDKIKLTQFGSSIPRASTPELTTEQERQAMNFSA